MPGRTSVPKCPFASIPINTKDRFGMAETELVKIDQKADFASGDECSPGAMPEMIERS